MRGSNRLVVGGPQGTVLQEQGQGVAQGFVSRGKKTFEHVPSLLK